MADEPIQTQPDTPTSETTEAAPVVAAPELEAGSADDTDGTVLGGKEEAPAPEAPAAEEAPAGPPEKYELALEGTTLDPAMVTEAEPVLRDLGLTNDQANTLLPVAAKLVSQTQDKTLQMLADAGSQQKKDWLDAFRADPDIGGAKAEETEHLAAKGLDALGFAAGHPFRKVLTETGFGNHPDMIRAMRKVGEMISEDGFVRSDGAAKVAVPTETRWYGNQGAN